MKLLRTLITTCLVILGNGLAWSTCKSPDREIVQISGAQAPGVVILDSGRSLRLAEIIVPISQDHWIDAIEPYLDRDLQLQVSKERSGIMGLSGHLFFSEDQHIDGQSGWIQSELVSRGKAAYFSFPNRTECADELLKIEKIARRSKLGIWGNEIGRSLGPNLPKPQFFISNSDAITLVDNFGAYGLISGKVLSIGEAGPWTYLNFGKNYLNDFTVRVTKTAVKQLRRRGIDIQQVPGHHVQVRGILKSRDGPLIDLFDSTQLTVEANFNSEQPAVSKP